MAKPPTCVDKALRHAACVATTTSALAHQVQPCVGRGLRKAACLVAEELNCPQWLLLLGAFFFCISLVLASDRVCFAYNRFKWIHWRFHGYLDLLFTAVNLFAVFAALPDGPPAFLLTVFTSIYLVFVYVGQRMVAQAFKPQRASSVDGGERYLPSTVSEPGEASPAVTAITVSSEPVHEASGSQPHADAALSRPLASSGRAGFAMKVSVFLVLTMVAMIILLTVHEGDPNLFCSGVVSTLCVLGVGRIFLIASGSETPFISAGCPLTSVSQAQQSSKRCAPLKLFVRAPGDTKFKLCELLNGETLDRFMTLLDDLSEDRVFITFQSVLLYQNVINPGELYATPCEFAKCFGLVLAPQHNHWVCFNRHRREHFLCYLRCLAKCHEHKFDGRRRPLPSKACLHVYDPDRYTAWPQDLQHWMASARPPLELPSVEDLNEVEASLPSYWGEVDSGARSSSCPPLSR